MKIMTYNIYNGAADTLDSIVSIVNDQDPDFLCLNEANGFDDNNNQKLHEFARRTGFEFARLERCGDGADYHVAVLSKQPVKDVQIIHPVSRAAILCTIETELGDITICATHLSPHSEEDRVEEVNLIFTALRSKGKSMVIGDLNSLSPRDPYPDDFVMAFNVGQMRKFTDGQKILFDVMNSFEHAGFVDSAIAFNKQADFTAPTAVNQDAEHSDMRLDYILVSSPLAKNIESYQVIKTETANQASDHFPVVVELS